MCGAFDTKLRVSVTKTIRVTSSAFKKILKLMCCTHSVVTSHFGRAIYTIQAGSSGKAKLTCEVYVAEINFICSRQ